jgi:ClpP class serine protease
MSVTEKLTARLPISRGPAKPVVAVVKLHGVITPTPSPLAARGTININTVEQALTKAFEHDRLRAVALAINSPGGAPTQSALVSERIRELAERSRRDLRPRFLTRRLDRRGHGRVRAQRPA